jgi:hypothetical protein
MVAILTVSEFHQALLFMFFLGNRSHSICYEYSAIAIYTTLFCSGCARHGVRAQRSFHWKADTKALIEMSNVTVVVVIWSKIGWLAPLC